MAFTKLISDFKNVSFNSIFKNKAEINDIDQENYLNIFFLNIRSFNKNNLELQCYLNSFNFFFDLIVLVEIWSNFEFSTDRFMPGYVLNYTINSNNKNGGVAIFSKNEHKISNLSITDCLNPNGNKNIDILGINLEINEQKFVIFGIYNHNANKIESLYKTLINLINKFGNNNRIIIASDLNINVLKYGMCSSITDFVDFLMDKNLSFIVDSPTRITNISNTLIDNFLLYGFGIGSEIFYSNLDCKITDHNALILGVKLTKSKLNKFIIKFRPFNKKLINNFNSNFKKDYLIVETSNRLKKF
jgi:hypothetical protein